MKSWFLFICILEVLPGSVFAGQPDQQARSQRFPEAKPFGFYELTQDVQLIVRF